MFVSKSSKVGLTSAGTEVTPRKCGQRIVEMIDGFRAANGRLQSNQELESALDVADWPCSECYDPRGPSWLRVRNG
jgi:hypothetical protein